MNAISVAATHQSRFFALYEYRRRLRTGGVLKSLSQSAALVLLDLADRADPTGRCWPSVARIATENPLSERSVQRGLRELEQRGLLVRESRPGSSCVFRLVLAVELVATVSHHPATSAPKGRHDGTQNMALEPSHGTEQQQDEREQLVGRVAVQEVDRPGELLREELAVDVDDQGVDAQPDRLPRELLDDLRQVGVRAPWRLAKHGADRLREALDMLAKAGSVKNPAGWLQACLTQGWTRTRTDSDRAAEVLTQATREHVAQVEQQRAQLADPDAARRSRLGMIVAIVKLKRPNEARLIELLGRHGLTMDDYASYTTAQEGQEEGCSSTAG